MSQCIQDPVSTANAQIQELVAKARAAQAVFEAFSQEQVGAIVKGIGKYVYDNAELLARMGLQDLLEKGLRQFDRVVVDSAPIFGADTSVGKSGTGPQARCSISA